MRPAAWDQNRGDPRFSDKKLARIQFAAALASAVAAGLAPRDRLAAAGESLLPYQESDGSWQVDTAAALGSPVTYGAAMATYMARKTLQAADPSRFRQAIDLAGAWFAKARPKSVLDAAALLLADGARQDCLELLMRSQTGDGGWGPYPGTPAEVFDTAVALLALCGRPDLSERLQRGRGWLVRAQLPEGGWRETTRPSGAQSYAQHISTSGWAALALLETRK